MTDPQDLSGVWYGRYASNADAQQNSFIALIGETGGDFTGTITEPDDAGGAGIRRADIAGRRTGQALYFVKHYTGRWTHSVRYSGRIDSAGTQIDGTWRIDGLTGGFTMAREQFSVEALEDETEAALILGDRQAADKMR